MTGKGKKIFVTQELPEQAMVRLEMKYDVDLWREETPPPARILQEKIGSVEGICCTLNDKINNEIIKFAGKRFKVISQVAVGYDNIDLKSATKKGIYVTNTPGVLTETTADFAFALIFAVARRVAEADLYVKNGKWKNPWGLTTMLGQDVWGKVLGIIGLGRIGEAVAQRAKGMNMKILYFDTFRKKDLEKNLDIKYVELDQIFRKSDFVTVHVPLLPTTRHLINEKRLKTMKKTACLINTSRGKVVDEKALYKALKDKWIWGAGLDVWENEPTNSDNPLLKMKNIVGSPHISSASVQTRNRMALMAIENLNAALHGKKPPNLVNTEVLIDRNGKPK